MVAVADREGHGRPPEPGVQKLVSATIQALSSERGPREQSAISRLLVEAAAVVRLSAGDTELLGAIATDLAMHARN